MNRANKISIWCISAAIAGHAQAADPPKKDARVTQLIRDVNLLPAEAPARPAAINDQVAENTAVRTGDESRSELTFEDLTITRLGANTIFTFNKAGRSVQLDSGSVLLRVPKDSGGAELRTKAVTVGVTGTTLILQATLLGNNNLIVLEGEARLRLIKHPLQSAKVRAGQMLDVSAAAKKVPAPVDVDLAEIMKTHVLIKDFPPLPSQDLIQAVIQTQQASMPGGSPGSQGTPRVTPAPTPAPSPRVVPNFTPTPRPTLRPTSVFSPTPKPTPVLTSTPKPGTIFTPTPKPKPTPRKKATPIPQSTPKPSPRATQIPTGNSKLPPGKIVKLPKKKIPTPTPTPSKIP